MPDSEQHESFEVKGGHLLFIGALEGRHRNVAILMHRRWVSSEIVFRQKTGRLVSADCILEGSHIRLISTHLPHGDDPMAEFVAALEVLEEAIAENRTNESHCIVGIDANAVLGTYNPYDNSHLIMTVPERNGRGEHLANFIHTSFMKAANTQ